LPRRLPLCPYTTLFRSTCRGKVADPCEFCCSVLHRTAHPFEAGWQSGHAADCKSVYAGSIPTSASSTKSPADIWSAGLFYAAKRRNKATGTNGRAPELRVLMFVSRYVGRNYHLLAIGIVCKILNLLNFPLQAALPAGELESMARASCLATHCPARMAKLVDARDLKSLEG